MKVTRHQKMCRGSRAGHDVWFRPVTAGSEDVEVEALQADRRPSRWCAILCGTGSLIATYGAITSIGKPTEVASAGAIAAVLGFCSARAADRMRRPVLAFAGDVVRWRRWPLPDRVARWGDVRLIQPGHWNSPSGPG